MIGKATTYYYDGTGTVSSTSSWWTNTNGTGSNPSNFTTASQVFIIQNASSVTIAANWTVSGSSSYITVGNGTNACTFTIPSGYTVSGTIYVSASGTLINQNATTPTLGTLSTGSTVTFAGTGTQTVPATTYSNLSITNTSATVSAAGSITINATLTINSSATFNMGAYILTAGSSFSTSGTGLLTTQYQYSGAISAGQTWSFTVEYNSSTTAQTFPNGGGTFTNLIIADSYGSVSLYGLITINGTLTINSGCVLNAGTYVIAGSFSTSGTGKLQTANTSSTPLPVGLTYSFEVDYTSTSSQTIVAGNYTTLNASATSNGGRTLGAGTVAVAALFTPGSTGTYTVTTGDTLSLGYTNTLPAITGSYNNLVIASGTITAPSLLTIAGTFILKSGASFIAPSSNFIVGGNWNNSGGTFTNNNGTVTLNGTGQSLTGSTPFYNFAKSVSSADVLTFPSGQTQTFTGVLSLRGTSGNLLSINASTSGSQATITPTAGQCAISYVSVTDNNNNSGTNITAGYASLNTNNTGWATSSSYNYAGDVYYFLPSTGDANSTVNWNTMPNGTGVSPSSITSSNNTYVINNGKSATITGNFGGTGVYISVGDETGGSETTGTSGTLTTASGTTYLNATINVNGTSTLNYQMLSGASYYPAFSYLSSGSTVVYNGSASQNVLVANYGNLQINNSAGVVLADTIGVSKTLSSLSGTINATSNSANIRYNGSTAQTIPGNSIFYNGSAYDITIYNDSGVTLTNNATLTIADSLKLYAGILKLGTGSNLIIQGKTYAPGVAVTDSTYKAGYTLVWDDEFNGTAGSAPNPNYWVHHYTNSTPTPDTISGYAFKYQSLANYSFLDGNGHLQIETNDSSNGIYYVGDVATSSPNNVMKQYGYMESKMMFTANNGVDCAFWMQSPTNATNPAANDPATYGTEIDICEYLGPSTSYPYGSVHTTIHKNGYGTYHQSTSNYTSVSSSGWHIVAVEWTPTYLNFYTDGVLKWTMSNTGFISQHPEYLLFSTVVTWESPNHAGNTWPVYMQVDYVRVYNKN